MKYFKFTGDYFALIMASNMEEAKEVYTTVVNDYIDENLHCEEVDLIEVATLASSPEIPPEDLAIVLYMAKNGTTPELLLVDADLI